MRIEVTNKCNLDCSYCHASPNTKEGVMTLEMVKEAIDKRVFLPELGQISLTGGEPFLESERTFEIATYLSKKRFDPIKIQTNGTLLSDTLLKPFLKIENLMIKVSLNGITENTNNTYRGKYNEAVRGIKIAVQMGFEVETTFVILPDNYNIVKEYAKFCQELGVTAIQLRRELGHTSLTDEMLEVAVEQSYEAAIPINLKSCLQGGEIKCFARPCLMVDGEIHPCGTIKESVGNLRDINQYVDLFKSPLLNKVIAPHKECAAVLWVEGRL